MIFCETYVPVNTTNLWERFVAPLQRTAAVVSSDSAVLMDCNSDPKSQQENVNQNVSKHPEKLLLIIIIKCVKEKAVRFQSHISSLQEESVTLTCSYFSGKQWFSYCDLIINVKRILWEPIEKTVILSCWWKISAVREYRNVCNRKSYVVPNL